MYLDTDDDQHKTVDADVNPGENVAKSSTTNSPSTNSYQTEEESNKPIPAPRQQFLPTPAPRPRQSSKMSDV